MKNRSTMRQRMDSAIREPWAIDFKRVGIDQKMLSEIHRKELEAEEPKYLKIKKGEADPLEMGPKLLKKIGRNAEIILETTAEILIRIPEPGWAVIQNARNEAERKLGIHPTAKVDINLTSEGSLKNRIEKAVEIAEGLVKSIQADVKI